MRNRIVLPNECTYSVAQRARILDVWCKPPIGVKNISGSGEEYPDLVVSQVYSGGRQGNDVRYISLKPNVGGSYQIIATESEQERTLANPKLVVDEIYVESGEFIIEKGKKAVQRYALLTKVTPNGRGSMAHRAIIDISFDNIWASTGRLWVSPEVVKREEEIRRCSPSLSDWL